MLPARVVGPSHVASRDAARGSSIRLGESFCRLLLTASSGEEEPEASRIVKHTDPSLSSLQDGLLAVAACTQFCVAESPSDVS